MACRPPLHSIRIALALRERFGVEPGDVVAMSMPLRLEWPLIERAIWGLGATSLPVRDSAGLVGMAPVVFFAERAAVDIPGSVRAPGSLRFPTALSRSSWMTAVCSTRRSAPPTSAYLPAACRPRPLRPSTRGESTRTRRGWRRSNVFKNSIRRRKAGTYRLGPERTDVASRVALYAGWGDGLTRTALGPEAPGIQTEGFVTLSQDGGV